MKTNVIMERKFLDGIVSQRSDDGFFSATDLVRRGNVYRLSNNLPMFNLNTFLSTKGTKEFVKTIKEQFGDVIFKSKNKYSHTWVHPYLFIDIALAINPELKIQVYQWIYDELIKYRNRSGDSYKKMAGALYLTISNKSEFTALITEVANRIKVECEVIDWQKASEDQLKLRDKIHEYISLLSDIVRDKNSLIDLAIKKAKDEGGYK